MGVRFEPAALLGVAVYSALLAAGLTALSLALAFYASHVAFFTITGVFLTPVLFLSSAFVPLDRLDGIWHVIALANPLTHAIDPMRALMVGGQTDYALHAGFLAGFDLVCFMFSVGAIKKKLD
jgi:ABC-2 type transport system permease protein